jgi:hypothetical protein
MAEVLKICHDRILPQDMFRPRRSVAGASGRAGVRRAVIEFRKLWINGSTLRVRFLEGTAEQQAKAREEAMWWMDQAHANLNFEFGDASDAEIRITFDPTDGAWSWVGTDARKIPFNQATMNLGFLDPGTAAHEFGHAIGMGHEHQNPRSGIEWNEDVVLRELAGPPNNWTPDQIKFNVLDKYALDQIRGTDFDPESIMLYFFPGRWVKSGIGTRSNEVLSELDKMFIASREAYPGKGEPQAVELRVNARSVKADIGKPGEEDLFQFTAKEEGRYVMSTGGQTDLLMKLFGPDSMTNLIAEDDDGGMGLNPKIVQYLAPGKYYLQVRHYNASAGTGPYTIRVKG